MKRVMPARKPTFPPPIIFLIFLLTAPALPGLAQTAGQRPYNIFNMRNLRLGFNASAARPTAMGGAAIALSDDPTAVMINPAGINFITRPALALSTRLSVETFREPSYSIADPPGEVRDRPSFYDVVFLSTVVPFHGVRLATFREVISDARFSLNAIAPLQRNPAQGVAVVLQHNFPSREITLRSQIVDNGATLAWRFSDKWHFGATVRLTRLDYQLNENEYMDRRLIGNGQPEETFSAIDPANLYLIRSVDERTSRLGFSVGFLGRLSPNLALGAVYHRRPAFRLSNRVILPRFQAVGSDTAVNFPPAADGSQPVRFDIPDSYGAGLSYRVPGRWSVVVDLYRLQLSELAGEPPGGARDPRDLIQDNPPGSAADPDNRPDLTLKNGWELRVGAEYIVRVGRPHRRVPLRAGFSSRPSALIYAQDVSAELRRAFPRQGRRTHLSAGLGFFFGDRLRFDGALNWSTDAVVLIGSSIYTF